MMYRGDLPRNYFNMTAPGTGKVLQLEQMQKHGPWFKWSEDPDCCIQPGLSDESLHTFAKQICIDNCIDKSKVNDIEDVLYQILHAKYSGYNFDGIHYPKSYVIENIKSLSLPEPLSTKLLAMI